MSEHTVVGQPVPRVDAAAKVTGQALYVADLKLPGMLYGKVLRSPYPHARIERLDTSRAERMPGVRAVVTGADFPSSTPPQIIARDRIWFEGQAIAAVAADSPEQAADALERIEVEYQVLPAVVDPLLAMQPGAPELHDNPKTRVTLEDGTAFVNLSSYRCDAQGDVAQGFAESDVVVEQTFRLEVVHQGYLEPHGAVARVEPTGKVTVWTSTQGHFATRDPLARMLQMPLTALNVIAPTLGGGFGAKGDPTVEPLCIRLAQKSGHPVQILMTREEEFRAASPAPRGVFTLKTGATRGGRLVAREARLIWDAGAFGGPGGGGVDYVRGPYRIPHVRVETFGVYTNKATPGAYRAPGYPQIYFASESQLDALARELQMDPVEFRLQNLMDNRDFSEEGRPPRIPVAFKETLRKAADMAGWGKGRPAGQGSPTLRRGVGVAIGRWDNWAGPSSCVITINEDGSIKHFSGAVDVTGSDTALAQIVAEELGVAVSDVVVSLGDTDSAPYAAVSAGSRVIYGQGAVARQAAREVKARLIELAAEQLEVEPEALEVRDHKVFVREDPETSLTLAELGRLSLWNRGGPIIGRASLADLPSPPVIAAQIAEVEVDVETGEVRVRRLVAAQDVGCAINRLGVEGQIQGGAVQGLGWGLHEAILYDAERGVLNPNFLDYRMPTARDVPEIEVGLVELNAPDGPFGAKGVGEPPIIPTPAALANAIYDAVGVRITDLPITAERIALALRASRQPSP